MAKKFLTAFFLLVLSSCISRSEKHGYMFDLSDSDMLQEGITSKERVLKIMGSPTIISALDNEETWIYYSESVKHILFFYPKTEERQILTLNFSDNGVVKDMKKINLADENNEIQFAENITEIDDHETSLFKSFVDNVGQVKPQ